MIARQNLSEGDRVTPLLSYSIQPRKRSWFSRWFLRLLVLSGVLAVVVSVLLPGLCGAREPANRIRCANNLRQIALAAMMYARDHGGAFPATMQELVATEELGASVFECPSDRQLPETRAHTSLKLGLSYFYVGNGVRPDVDRPDTAVIVYEPLSNHSNDGMEVHLEAIADHTDDGMNVVFADAHAQWIAAPKVASILKQAAAGVRPIRYDGNSKAQP